MLTSIICAMFFTKKQDAISPELKLVASWHEFTAKDIDGKTKQMSDYKGKVVMVVNVASKCGLTPQYAGLEALYEKYKERGFVILGFPCNDFAGQEPGDESQIKQFCSLNYKVSFPMFSKLHVKGAEQDPMYKWLVWKTGGKDIEWNFGKILIDQKGNVITRFNPKVAPDESQIATAIEASLASQ